MLAIIMAEIIGVKPKVQVVHSKTIKAKRKKQWISTSNQEFPNIVVTYEIRVFFEGAQK
jgi:hypothetical protein